jgi:TRAP-type mannitol/chloroaromatic compound transport system permease small subunit
LKLVRGLIAAIEWLNHKIGLGAAWLTTALVLLICFDVFNRYLLNKSFVAVQELEWHLFSLIFLLGAAYTLKQDGHVRVDVFYAKASEQTRALIDLVGCLVLLIPFCALVIWTSKDFVLSSYAIAETSPDPGGLPARFLLKASLPLAFLLLLLQGCALALRSLLRLLGSGELSDGGPTR